MGVDSPGRLPVRFDPGMLADGDPVGGAPGDERVQLRLIAVQRDVELQSHEPPPADPLLHLGQRCFGVPWIHEAEAQRPAAAPLDDSLVFGVRSVQIRPDWGNRFCPRTTASSLSGR